MRRYLLYIAAALLALWATSASALTLEEAIALGRVRSLQLRGPQIDRLKIEGQITEAWSNALPQIQGQAGVQQAWKENLTFLPDFTDLASGRFMKVKMQPDNAIGADVTLTQPIYTFGRIGAGLKAAYAARRSNDHFLDNTTRSLELEVSKRFWGVLLMRDVVEARKSSLAISDSSLTKVSRMRDVGLMSDYDVLRIQVQANNQIPQLRQAENNLQLAELSLRELLGVSMDSSVTPEGNLSDYAVSVDTTVSSSQVSGRDDLEALRDLVTMNKEIYNIYHSMHYPSIGGQIKYSWQWASDQWGINPNNNNSSVYGGISISIPIWTSGQYVGRVRQYRAEWQKSQLSLEQAERGARMQFESALDSYRTALASEDAAKLTVTQATQARSIAQTKLAQGQITPLEMDAAQLDELVAKVTLAQAKYDRLVASAEVRMAVGLAPYSKLENTK